MRGSPPPPSPHPPSPPSPGSAERVRPAGPAAGSAEQGRAGQGRSAPGRAGRAGGGRAARGTAVPPPHGSAWHRHPRLPERRGEEARRSGSRPAGSTLVPRGFHGGPGAGPGSPGLGSPTATSPRRLLVGSGGAARAGGAGRGRRPSVSWPAPPLQVRAAARGRGQSARLPAAGPAQFWCCGAEELRTSRTSPARIGSSRRARAALSPPVAGAPKLAAGALSHRSPRARALPVVRAAAGQRLGAAVAVPQRSPAGGEARRPRCL